MRRAVGRKGALLAGEGTYGTLRALKWAVCSVLVGAASGAAALLLTFAANESERFFSAHPLAAGLLVPCMFASYGLYRALGVPFSTGTLTVVNAVRNGGDLKVETAPAIIASTALSLIGGASVGKEAAALQSGGSLAAGIARLFGLEGDSTRFLVAAGMAAAFSALLCAPFAAIAFVAEVVRPRIREVLDVRSACIAVAVAASWVLAGSIGAGNPWQMRLAVPEPSAALVETVVVSVLCCCAGLGFVVTLKLVHTASSALFPSDLARVAVGAACASGFTLVVFSISGEAVASGTGSWQIISALAGDPHAFYEAAFKVGLTAVCLGFGIKGGEIMPVLCIGALVGAAWSAMTGEASAFAAAVGVVAALSACARCPVAAFLLGVELFGSGCAPYFALAALAGLLPSYAVNLYDGATWSLDEAFPWRSRPSE